MVRNVECMALIGCGGIGSWLLGPLLRFLNAERFQGAIHLWDGDRYSAGNAARQEFDFEHLGANKALGQAGIFTGRYPALRLRVHAEYVTSGNVHAAVCERALILVAVDNHPARALIARRAAELREVYVLSSGNETLDGNVHVTLRRGAKDLTVPLLARHPEVAHSLKGDRAEAGCEERVAQGETQLLVTNFLAAASLLAAFHALWTHGARHGRRKNTVVPQEVYFDAGNCAMALVPVNA
ncbi:MAG: ThiF family adenylyltransferase [Planctomycetes bacterium]|nr:ThiF family adenylyltransferase [Planctomycetota bacterium]